MTLKEEITHKKKLVRRTKDEYFLHLEKLRLLEEDVKNQEDQIRHLEYILKIGK